MMKNILRALHIMEMVAAGLVIVAAAVVTIPAAFGIRPYIVRSGSMEPALHTGALAFVNTQGYQYQIGDVITYRLTDDAKEPILVTHRIIGRTEAGFVTKGDANEMPDLAPVTEKQVVGRLLWQIPSAGYLAANVTPEVCVTVLFWILFFNGLSMVAANLIEKAEIRSEDSDIRQKKKRKENGITAV